VGLFPEAASAQAVPIDRLVNLQLWMIAFLFSLIMVFISYSVIVFRRRKNEQGDGAYFKGSSGLEVVWTIFPLATVIGLSFLGAQALGQVREPDPAAMEVNVIAFQWGWIFEYPDQGIQSNELYLPVNKQVLLHLTSRDVIHSFWVPEFRVKQDALPGKNLVKELRITPTKIGDYTVMCAELCGGAHAYMTSPVRVVSQADFDAWLAGQAGVAQLPPAERGQKVAQGAGCQACHSVDGTRLAGPTWKGLAGSQVPLQGGGTVTADDEYLHESIVNPIAKIHEGFAPIMPTTYKDTLSEQQIRDIIEFIKTVK
jgi:cytochrome c oxidase subunit II